MILFSLSSIFGKNFIFECKMFFEILFQPRIFLDNPRSLAV